MKNQPCATATLVEASHDGRLGEREAASVARHLRTCAVCAAKAADLAVLRRLARERPAAPSAIEHRRGRLRLLREAARIEPRRELQRPALLAIAMAAVVLLGVGGALWAWRGGAPSSASVAGAVTSARTETTVQPSEGARFSRQTTPEADVVTLDAGTLDVAVKKLAPGERFTVRTSDAEVEVRGTRFSVVAQDGKLMAVTVREGRVEVRRLEGTLVLDPGDEWRTDVVDPPAQAEQSPARVEEPAPRENDEPAAPSSAAPVQRAPIAAPRVSGTAKSMAGASATGAGSSAAFREGVRRMEQGDYGAAAEGLKKFADSNPNDARAEDAAFLAVLSLQRAGRRAEAAEAARRYLAAFPDGYRRAEAKAIAGQ
jgi:ferric-dicitrate binding protein FerR (iron transport regulator)